jgi:DNA-binding LacI/PurR family transcriptional regulator
MLAMGLNDRHHFLEDFVGTEYPLVVCDNYFPNLKLDHVVCNYRSGAEQVMNYLLQLGHRKIGFIYAAPEVRTARDVSEAYKARLQTVDVRPEPTLMEDGKFTEQGGATACEKILQRHPDVTAFLAGNDKMALGAIHYLTRRGIEVPKQISVVGLDDLQSSAFVTPALTTLHLPLYEVGALACEKLIDRIQGTIDRVAEVLPTHLVVRESTALAATNGAS